MSTDTIGPDGPPLSTEGWEAGVREMSTDDLRAALRQARKDGAEMRRQRDAIAEEYRVNSFEECKLRQQAQRDALEALAERDEALAELEAMRASNPQLSEAAGHIAAAHELTKGWAT